MSEAAIYRPPPLIYRFPRPVNDVKRPRIILTGLLDDCPQNFTEYPYLISRFILPDFNKGSPADFNIIETYDGAPGGLESGLFKTFEMISFIAGGSLTARQSKHSTQGWCLLYEGVQGFIFTLNVKSAEKGNKLIAKQLLEELVGLSKSIRPQPSPLPEKTSILVLLYYLKDIPDAIEVETFCKEIIPVTDKYNIKFHLVNITRGDPIKVIDIEEGLTWLEDSIRKDYKKDDERKCLLM